jgi:type II secretion system protein H
MGSEPSEDHKTANREPRTANRVSGFTLLELILVLVVVGLGASLAAARLSSMRGSVGVDMAAQSFIDQARRCQHLASVSGQNVRLRLDPTARTLQLTQLDGTTEQKPGDGDDAEVALSHSADEFTVNFARGDGVKDSGKESSDTVDFLFSPDRRCDPAGTVTFTTKTRSASVRLSGGARLPKLIAQEAVTP